MNKFNIITFLGYMFFAMIIAFGFSELFKNFPLFLIITGFFGLLYLLINNFINSIKESVNDIYKND